VLPGRRYSVEEVWYLVVRFKWLILLPWAVVSLVTVGVAHQLPDRFRSESLIQVIAQRVPQSLVRSTVTAPIQDRLPAISQQILSRTKLERIIQDFGLYAEERKAALMEDIVRDMRNDINVTMVKGDAFRVSFVSSDPRTAMKVAERLASLFVEENLRDREVMAEGANQFLDSQLDEARRRLLEHEKKLEEYRRQFSGELPSQLQGNMQSIQSLQNQIGQLAESINRDKDRKLVLDRQVADLNADVAPSPSAAAMAGLGSDMDAPPVAVGTAAQQLEGARSQLQAMLLRLKPEHPDIARARRVIAELERKAEEEAVQAPVSLAARPKPPTPQEAARRSRLRDIRNEVEMIDRQMKQKEEAQARAQRAIGDLQRRVDVTPTRESEMIALNRDYDTLRGMYTNLLAKGEDAKVAANLERRQIGEQFKVVDAARVPERPFSPDRQTINLAGVAGGLLFGIGLVGLLEFRDSSFRTDDDVVAVLALPVLASVPALMTSAERQVARRHRAMAVAAALVAMAGAIGLFLLWRGGFLDRWL